MKLTSGDHIWHVEIHQNRIDYPWFLMIHGFMGSGDLFAPLITHLKTFCNPVTLDLPGHGRSSKPHTADDYTTGRLVDGLASVLNRLTFHPLFLHGYSMGGRLALRTACLHPELLDGLVIESSTPGITDDKRRSERIQLDVHRATQLTDNFTRFLQEWWKNPLFSGSDERSGSGSAGEKSAEGMPPTGDTGLTDRYYRIMEEQDPAAMAAVLRGFSPGTMPSSWDLLPSMTRPTCLIAGERDEKFRQIHAEMSKRLPHAQHHLVQGAFHRTHLDNPSEFSKLVQTFIQTVPDP